MYDSREILVQKKRVRQNGIIRMLHHQERQIHVLCIDTCIVYSANIQIVTYSVQTTQTFIRGRTADNLITDNVIQLLTQ